MLYWQKVKAIERKALKTIHTRFPHANTTARVLEFLIELLIVSTCN